MTHPHLTHAQDDLMKSNIVQGLHVTEGMKKVS